MSATPLSVPFTDPGTKIFESLVNAVNAYPADQTMIDLRATIDAHPEGFDYQTLLCLALIASVRTSVLGAGVFGQDLAISRDLAVGRNQTIAGTLSVAQLVTLAAGLTIAGISTHNGQTLLNGDVVGAGIATGSYDETKFILQMLPGSDPTHPNQIFKAIAPAPRTFDLTTQLAAPTGAVTIATGGSNTDLSLSPTGTGQVKANAPFAAKHIIGNSTTPGIAAGAGAGTGPTIALATGSNDISGAINLTTGTSPTVSAVIATLTFALAYLGTKLPTVIITPGNAATAAIMAAAASAIWTTDALGNFAINANATGLTASTAYVFKYHVLQ